MKIPCAFVWLECSCEEAKAKRCCELQDSPVPYWARQFLAEQCPFLGGSLNAYELGEFEESTWRWKGKENDGR